MGSKQHLTVVFLILVFVEYLVFRASSTVQKKYSPISDSRFKRSSSSQGCRVKIQHLPYLQPVFISGSNPPSLMIPQDGYLTWSSGQSSWITCFPSKGSTNPILGVHSQNKKPFVQIKCDSGVNFFIGERLELVDITKITCQNKVTGNFKIETTPQCQGSTYKIGFRASDQNSDVVPLYYSCFDDSTFSALYSRHTLYGHEIDHKFKKPPEKQKKDVDFKNPGFPSEEVDIDELFKGISQRERLRRLFLFNKKPGSSVVVVPTSVAEVDHAIPRLINLTHFFERGHLNPNADHLFTAWQWSTYFYVNVVPMWNKINNGNWARLETNVRTFAKNTKHTLQIITGTFGTAEFCISDNRCREFTLSDQGVRIPQYLWKIVKPLGMNAAIAFVVSNNPHRREPALCEDLRSECGWNNDIHDKNDIRIGAVSFCSVSALKRKVQYIPDMDGINHVLHFNGAICNPSLGL